MKSSLIVTTYNWPQALQLILKSALNQAILPVEIIIADDGSTDSTKKMIKEVSADIPIKHVWQKDRGFRASRIRNKAIAVACCDYIIMIDGDMVLEHHFIADHLRASAPKQFIQGSRVLLPDGLTVSLLEAQSTKISVFDRGLGNRKNMSRSSLLSKLFSKRKSSLGGIKTCNFSFWREDAIMVNGFNEDFEGWGREDSEFAARLMFAGVARKNLRFKATAMHLFHPYQERVMLPRNDRILAKTVNGKLTKCTNGLAKHI